LDALFTELNQFLNFIIFYQSGQILLIILRKGAITIEDWAWWLAMCFLVLALRVSWRGNQCLD